MASTRCGISAKQIQRETGVTYKTAWRMFKKIRELLDEPNNGLSGQVEVDETYVGGRHKGKRGRGAFGKTMVIGAAQREGRIVAKTGSDASSDTLLPFITDHVLPESTVYTDELPSYNPVGKSGYVHRRIHHASRIYVMGDIHTNTVEGFWSLLKRGVGGVYHAASQKHLQSYLDEYSFRYNHRNDEQPMFTTVLKQIEKT